MANYEDLAEQISNKELKNITKRKKMRVSGKSVFKLKEIIQRGKRGKK